MDEINEQVFCLGFELKTISNAFFYGKAERWVKNFLHLDTEIHHLNRYNFVVPFVKDKLVLDLACGCGYGTFLLATKGNAKLVIGVDLDEESIRYGNFRYKSKNIERIVFDATKFDYKDRFDSIICFETIEHVSDFELLVNNLHELLIDNGELYISTPINKETTRVLSNPYHVIEWSFYDFHKLFSKKFTIDDIYIQDVVIDKNLYSRTKLIPRLKNRFLKLFNVKPEKKLVKGKSLEKFNNQYNMNLCVKGYQILKLKKISS
jgi:SAM-dependent methyltransferase